MYLGNKIKILLFFACAVFTGSVAAFTPTAQQMAQFQSLPLAQQQALAKQYGIDLSLLTTDPTQNPAQQPSQKNTIGPRKTLPNQASQRRSLTGYGDELKPFGYNVFAGEPSTFTPIDDLPVPNNYLLGTGDQLVINIFGKENYQVNQLINRQGAIDIPKLGPVQIAGLTFEQAKNQLEERIKKQILGVDVTVTVGAFRTSQVSVFGEAYQPGSYNVSAFATVTQVLKAAGGIDTTGSLRDIQISRNGKVIAQLDLYNFLIDGDISGDRRLESGDSVFIPARKNSVYIQGEVVRPAIYEIKENDSLSTVLRYAGGVKAQGYQEKISVRRKLASGIKVFDLDITTSEGQGFVIQDGDDIVIRSKTSFFNKDVVLRGAVVRPGVHEHFTGITVADLFKDTNQSLNANADLNYALVVRETNIHRDIDVIQFDLGKALSEPNSDANIVLNPRDQVLVFSNTLDGEYWYGEGQNKTREDWKNEQLAKDIAEQQREMMIYQLSLSQQSSEHSQANTMVNGQRIDSAETFDDQWDKAANNNRLARPQEQESSLRLRDLEKKEEQQEIDFDSRENLLEPVIKRLMHQSSFDNQVQIVEIRGAVRYPGIYPLAKGSTIQDLIVAGGGLRESAYQFTAELSRVNAQQGKFEIDHQSLDLAQILAGHRQFNLALQSKDRVNIFTKPEWREDYSIELQGEVVFPGTYTFRRGETIKDVIERAGGLTQYAYPEGAIFSRESLRQQEAERMKLINRQLRQEIASLTLRRQSNTARFTTSPSEALAIADQLDTVEPIGRLVINLPEIMAGEQDYDILLENRDSLYIPPLRNIISVIGEVQFSSSHQFNHRLTLEEYLNKAGGPKRQADIQRMYVIRANGSVMMPNRSYWFSRQREELKPGDTIVVPIDTDYLDNLSAWTSATQILYQMGVAWKAIKD